MCISAMRAFLSALLVFWLQLSPSRAGSNLRGRQLQAPPDSALIVVDMQNDFISGSLQVPDAESIIGRINSLSAMPGWNLVAFTMDYHPLNHFSFAVNSPLNKTSFSFVDAVYDKSSRICGKEYVDLYGGSATENCSQCDIRVNFSQQLWPVHCVQGTWGQQIDDRVKIPASAAVVKKGLTTVVDSYGAFENNFAFESKATEDPNEMETLSENSLATLLKLANVKNVYMTGVALDYCVKYTAMQAVDRHFSTAIIQDATKAVSEEQGVEAIAELRQEGVSIISSSTLR
jgi:nicotinamidase-related amidase